MRTVSVLVGIAFVGVFFIIINQLLKLAEHNRFKISDTLRQSAEVYVLYRLEEAERAKFKLALKVLFMNWMPLPLLND